MKRASSGILRRVVPYLPGGRSPAALARPTLVAGALTLALAACAATHQTGVPGASSTRAAVTQTARAPLTTTHPGTTSAVTRSDPCAQRFPGIPVGRALATLYAGSLLCVFAVPPGARRLTSVPDAGHGALSQSLPPTGLADEVSRTQFWQVPGDPQGVLAWEKLHLPHVLAWSGSGSGSLRGTVIEWQDDYGLPAIPAQASVSGQINSRTMSLFAVGAGNGRTDIEVEVSVEWIPPRPATEVVPPAVRAVTIAAVPDMNLHITPPTAVTVTDPSRVRRIVALIDGLPLSPPGVFSCPFDAGAEVVLTFRALGAGGSPLAVADDDLEGCEWTSLTIGGKQQPSLGAPNGGRSAAAEILRVAGLPWNLSKLVM